MPVTEAHRPEPDAAQRARPVLVGRKRDPKRDDGKPVLHPPTLQRPPYWIKALGRG